MSFSHEITTRNSLPHPLEIKESKKRKFSQNLNPDAENQQQIHQPAASVSSINNVLENDERNQRNKNIPIKKPKTKCRWICNKLINFSPHLVTFFVFFCLYIKSQAQFSELETRISLINTVSIKNSSKNNVSDEINNETSSLNITLNITHFLNELDDLKNLNEYYKKKILEIEQSIKETVEKNSDLENK